MMKAAVHRAYGPPEVVKIEPVAKPTPNQNQILVRTVATTVDVADARVRSLNLPGGTKLLGRLAMGLTGPKRQILGMQVSGVVEAVGDAVTNFNIGDAVVGSTGFENGCHAEYVCLDAGGAVVMKPDNLSHEDAVSVLFGGSTALGFFDLAGLKSGDDILINGASGAVGTMAVQLAKHMGARVTAVCSGKNAELVKALGADQIIDYTKGDFARSDGQYDLIMDNVGNAPFKKVKHLLKPDGRVLVVIFKNMLGMISAMRNNRALILGPQDEQKLVNAEIFARLLAMVAAGDLKPVIENTYAFDEIADAHRHVDTGRKVGAVVVRV